MRAGWKNMQSVKSARSMLYLEFKTRTLPPLEGNDKCHMNDKCSGGHPVLHRGSKLN